MVRVRSCSSSKCKKIKVFRNVKGFINRRKNVYSVSKQSFFKALLNSRRDRKKRSSFLGKEYKKTINWFLNNKGINYSKFSFLKKKKNIKISDNVFYLILKSGLIIIFL